MEMKDLINLPAIIIWSGERTTISPVFFPRSCEWKDNNSCSIFTNEIELFEITWYVRVAVWLCNFAWAVKYRFWRYFRYQLPHKIYQGYLRRTYIDNGLPF